MSARIKKADEIELARKFLDLVYDMIEDGDDTIYELLDPECKYGDELVRRLNNDTIKEILALGFRAKYGEDWHEPAQGREPQPQPPHWVGVACHYAVCSECDGAVSTGFETAAEAVERWPSLYPFCPHCGVRMQSSEYGGPHEQAVPPPKGRGGKEGGDGRHD